MVILEAGTEARNIEDMHMERSSGSEIGVETATKTDSWLIARFPSAEARQDFVDRVTPLVERGGPCVIDAGHLGDGVEIRFCRADPRIHAIRRLVVTCDGFIPAEDIRAGAGPRRRDRHDSRGSGCGES